MKASILGVLLVFGVVLSLGGAAFGEGLLGERYAMLELSATRPGDDVLRDIDNGYFGVLLGVNWPVHKHIDLGLSVAHSDLDGLNALGVPVEQSDLSVSGLVVAHFMPESAINPFIAAGAVFTDVKVEIGAADADDDDVGPQALVGMDIPSSNNGTARVFLKYYDLMDSDDILIGAGYHQWLSERWGVGINVYYGFDSQDLITSAALTTAF